MRNLFTKLIIASLFFTVIACTRKNKRADTKQSQPQSLILDKKELECKRKNWNRVPKKEGYVMDVVSKQEYKPASK